MRTLSKAARDIKLTVVPQVWSCNQAFFQGDRAGKGNKWLDCGLELVSSESCACTPAYRVSPPEGELAAFSSSVFAATLGRLLRRMPKYWTLILMTQLRILASHWSSFSPVIFWLLSSTRTQLFPLTREILQQQLSSAPHWNVSHFSILLLTSNTLTREGGAPE